MNENKIDTSSPSNNGLTHSQFQTTFASFVKQRNGEFTLTVIKQKIQVKKEK